MDIIGAVREVKAYNARCNKFLIGRHWFEDVKEQKMILLKDYDKLTMMLRKVFPKADTKLMLADVTKNYFGINDSEKINELFGCEIKNVEFNDEEVDFFLSPIFKKCVF